MSGAKLIQSLFYTASMHLPPQLKQLEKIRGGSAWLHELPSRIKDCSERWSLQLGEPYPQSQTSLVLPATGKDGTPAVLKIQFPCLESAHEAAALRCWNGNGAVRLLGEAAGNDALLLERCQPGDHLSTVHLDEALEVLSELLPPLWIKADKPFVSLQKEVGAWSGTLPRKWEVTNHPFAKQLLDAALEALAILPQTQGEQVLIHQDLHGDNVLRAQRQPWLAIDPKPLIGEREFALAPIVRSSELGHSRKEVIHRLDNLSSALGLNRERARLWTLAQTLAWSFEGDRVLHRHVDVARWLVEA